MIYVTMTSSITDNINNRILILKKLFFCYNATSQVNADKKKPYAQAQ